MKSRTSYDIFEMLSDMEPSFQQTGPDVGQLAIDDVAAAVDVHRDPTGWCTLTLPLPRLPRKAADDEARIAALLLETQCSIPAPVKFGRDRYVNRCYLIGEIPAGRTPEARSLIPLFTEIRAGFARGISAFSRVTQRRTGLPRSHTRPTRPSESTVWGVASQDIRAQIAAFLTQWGEGWSTQDTGFLIALDTEQYFQKIGISTKREGVVHFQSRLSEFREDSLSAESRLALTDFVLIANRQLRLARASIATIEEEGEQADGEQGDRGDNATKAVVLEVAAVAEALTPGFIEHALSALIVAARVTTVEVQTLCHQDVAATYLNALYERSS